MSVCLSSTNHVAHIQSDVAKISAARIVHHLKQDSVWVSEDDMFQRVNTSTDSFLILLDQTYEAQA